MSIKYADNFSSRFIVRYCNISNILHASTYLLVLSSHIILVSSQFGYQASNIASSPYFYDESVTISTEMGILVGKTVFLYDGPNRSAFDRSISQLYKPPNSWQRPSIPNVYKNVTVFLGVPYAKPPTREFGLRFQLPQQMDKWEGTLSADKFRPSCPQPAKYTGIDRSIAETDEDCLYLNIYTPYAKPRAQRLFPVIMHIHGGKFEHGSGNAFPGHMFAASQEVVIVTFNYRLGVLGFFATADNSSAGNFGLADQIAAIQWVRDHISNFNGDPQSITLWGTEAGAASAGILALSNRGRDLVKRVIAQSGSALAAWAVKSNPILISNNSITIGDRFGCPYTDSYSLVKCLESKSFNIFTSGDVDLEIDVGWLPYSPVEDIRTRDRDLSLVPGPLSKYIALGNLRFPDNFQYMSGITRDEGSAWILDDEEIQRQKYHITPSLFANKVRNFIKVFNVTYNQKPFIDAIDFQYSPSFWERSNLTALRQGLIDMYSDSWILSGHDQMLRALVSRRIPTYSYVLNYTIQGLIQPEPWVGVCHDTEYFLLSGAPFMESKYFPSFYNLKQARWTEMDRNMSQLFMEAYANFAKTGNPTPYSLFNNILWEPTFNQNLQYLSINTTNFTTTMKHNYRHKAAQFWNEYIQMLLQHDPVNWDDVPYSPLEMELRAYKASAYAILLLALILCFISLLCSCLYCRARKYKYGDADIDYMPVPNESGVLHYGPPSKRVNSDFTMKLPTYVQNQLVGQQTRAKNPRMTMEKTMNDKHTLV